MTEKAAAPEDQRHVVRFGEDYEEYFSPSTYLTTYYLTPESTVEDDYGIITANNWHDAFASGEISGERMLDIGTGPNLQVAIPVSRRFSEIYLSDYAACNRQAIHDWLARKPHAHDWTPFFKYYAQKEDPKQNWQLVENRVRNAIKDIFPCDVNQENPLYPLNIAEFDCVTTVLCIAAACKDKASYKSAVRNVISLLKPGGHFIQVGVLNDSFYKVGNEKFFYLKISLQLLKEAIKEAGCTIASLLINGGKSDQTCSDFEGFFFLVAHKNK